MDALETLFTRRSVRRFRPDPVERSEIEKIIEAGRLAATTKEKIGEKIGKIGDTSHFAQSLAEDPKMRIKIQIKWDVSLFFPSFFLGPLALPFWAATIWAFYPEWRLTRQARRSTTTAQSLDGGSFPLAFFYVLVALAAAFILAFLPIIAFAAAFPKWRPCHP